MVMKKVHVVFKTHLDLGFTDLASNVLANYNSSYIPKAIDSRILSIGKIDNLDFDKYDTDINNGFYFHLLNTSLETNFTMWYEEDIHAKFKISFNKGKCYVKDIERNTCKRNARVSFYIQLCAIIMLWYLCT